MLTPRLWQQAVLEYLEDTTFERFRDLNTPRTYNLEFGIRINMGRRRGHTSLAQMVLEKFPDAVMVVPTEVMRKRLPKELHDRIWVCSPQEAIGKADIISKIFEPLKSGKILIIDNASYLSEWELETLRAGSWDKYVELQ
jgi:hypothetical protein